MKLEVFVVSSLGSLAAAMHFLNQKRSRREKKLIPLMDFTGSGRADRIERFSHYVARQLGFTDPNKFPQLCKLADDYLRKIKGCEENIYNFFSTEKNAEYLYSKLIDEFDNCILGYFAFHWNHASLMISQVLSAESEPIRKLKTIVMAATRKQRFERVSKDLKLTRLFSTLVEEMKAIGHFPGDNSPRCTDVMAPVIQSDRSPVLLLMGGGMGAGKSTVLKDILKEPFWAGAAEKAVVVEADAFKESDVIYRALSSRGHHDMLQTAELTHIMVAYLGAYTVFVQVHQSSMDAASSLLVTALNEGRDVIMDGTLSWAPFVEQTIAMARNVHRRQYRMGVGYKVADDGSVTENYWEEVPKEEEEEEEAMDQKRKPYRIELVGVVSDPYLAVVRGIRRAILMGRAVRVKSQLKSHKMFAIEFPGYCRLVDHARLYCTNAMGSPPKLIGWKDGDCEVLVDPDHIDCLRRLTMLDEDSECVHALYTGAGPACAFISVWTDVVASPSRVTYQQELKIAIEKVKGPSS